MKHHSLEIYVNPPSREVLCFIGSPAYGECAPTMKFPCQTMTLSDGFNRVNVAVHGCKLDLDTIKTIARSAVDRNFIRA